MAVLPIKESRGDLTAKANTQLYAGSRAGAGDISLKDIVGSIDKTGM